MKQRRRRIKITHLHPLDAFSCPWSKVRVVGETGFFDICSRHRYPGYFAGWFYPDDLSEDNVYFFAGIRYVKI